MRPHESGVDCWCCPAVVVLCPECEDETLTCWRCGGDGIVPADLDDDRTRTP